MIQNPEFFINLKKKKNPTTWPKQKLRFKICRAKFYEGTGDWVAVKQHFLVRNIWPCVFNWLYFQQGECMEARKSHTILKAAFMNICIRNCQQKTKIKISQCNAKACLFNNHALHFCCSESTTVCLILAFHLYFSSKKQCTVRILFS